MIRYADYAWGMGLSAENRVMEGLNMVVNNLVLPVRSGASIAEFAALLRTIKSQATFVELY